VALEDRVVFGFDSGIAKGGVGVYYPEQGAWEFLFLRWKGGVRSVQMSDLKTVKGIWIGVLGVLRALTVSENLEKRRLLHLEGLSPDFNRFMDLAVGGLRGHFNKQET